MAFFGDAGLSLFHEHEVDSQDQADEGGDMVPVEGLALEDKNREQGEDGQGDYFLYHLELDEVEGAAVVHETYAVGRHLKRILEEGDAPREEDDPDQGPVVDD